MRGVVVEELKAVEDLVFKRLELLGTDEPLSNRRESSASSRRIAAGLRYSRVALLTTWPTD